ncbi:MAG: hypothetical protein M1838_004391 [Thelocarpon superellum]|nr:MAG: hypothetical protein M1838_004391 [Thelocarpon superellum]
MFHLVRTLVVLGALAATLEAAPATAPGQVPLGVSMEQGTDHPILTTSSGRWRANLALQRDIYTFKNIRFGQPPVGDLRWEAPKAPDYDSAVSDGSYGPICHQTPVKGLNLVGPGAGSAIGAAANQFLGGIPIPIFTGGSEDCLFLDVYVPAKALQDPQNSKLPVVVWFYGGAYVFGSKDALEPIPGFYDGSGLLRQSKEEMIFVAGNYRLGAFGFLAGQTMEEGGLPNAGLHDQRMVLQWVQDNIHLLGGDPTQVSAWGESAGASSIMHHLVQMGGTQDPLFQRAFVQSPAYEVFFDRRGSLEETFDAFAAKANCAGQGLACLRAAAEDTLTTANTELNADSFDGGFAVGPAPDGKFIRQCPTLELATGNYWKGLESIVISHVSDEAEIFVDGHITNSQQFDEYINDAFPNYTAPSGLNAIIEQRYPASRYASTDDRTKALVRDVSFTCNTRYLANAYSGRAWNMQYSVGLLDQALHASDLLPLFYDIYLTNPTDFGSQVAYPLVPGFGPLAAAYQSYLTSHAIYGDPNAARGGWGDVATIDWPEATTSSDQLGNVLNVGNLGFSLINDDQNTNQTCRFWLEAFAAASSLGGYSAPGAVVPSTLVPIPHDPSAQFATA